MVKNTINNYEEYLSEFMDHNLVNSLKTISGLLFFIVFLVSLLLTIFNFMSFDVHIFGDMDSIIIFHPMFFALISFSALLISEYNIGNINSSKKYHYSILIIFMLIFIFLLIVLFDFFNIINLNNSGYLSFNLMEFIVFMIYIFIVLSIFFRVNIKSSQLCSLLFIIVGYGGFLFYFGFTTKYNLALGYLIYSLIFGFGLMIMCPDKGFLKTLCLKTTASKFARVVVLLVPIILAIFSITVIYLDIIFDLPKGLVASAAMVIMFVVIFVYSKRLAKSSYEKELSDETAISKEIFYEDIIEHMVEGIIVLDKNNKIVYVNRSISESFSEKDNLMAGVDFKETQLFNIFNKECSKAYDDLVPIFIDSKAIDFGFKNKYYENNHNEINNFKEVSSQEGSFNNHRGSENIHYVSGWFIPMVGENLFQGAILTIVDVTKGQNKVSGLKSVIMEKNILLSEVHHRVKTNMQIIKSLLNLEYHHTNNEDLKEVLRESQCKVVSMALVHENLYSKNDLHTVNMEEYVASLITELKRTYSKFKSNIYFNYKILNVQLNSEIVMALGLIINELVTNSIKYAFPDNQKGVITIVLNKIEEEYVLIVMDNGVGFDKFASKGSGTGSGLVESLVLQIEGSMDIDILDGTRVAIKFRDINQKDMA